MRPALALSLACVMGVLSASASAQMNAPPSLSGRVVDSEGAPLAGALVTVRNDKDGSARHLTADQRGEYTLPAPVPGRYDVTVSLLGFQEERRPGLEVGAAGLRVPDVTLGLQQVSVATQSATPLRATPGIITLVSAEEIADSGARDLLDVLRMVPGLAFGMDVEGVVGIAVRGNWAHEGKALLLVDGQEQDELMYSTLQFGRHFPAEIIQRIEIIRGPGSVIYGGNAELTVINVVTRGPEDLEGVRATGSYSQTSDTYGQRRITLEGAHRSGELGLSGSAALGQGNRSDRTYTDIFGTSYDLADNAKLDIGSVNLGLKYRGLSLRFIEDRYHTTMRDVFAAAAPYPIDYDFDSTYGEARLDWHVGKSVTLTPRLSFRVHRPWRADTAEALALEDEPDLYGGVTYHRSGDRALGGVNAAYSPAEGKLRLLAGFETYRDHGQDDLPGSTFSNGTTDFSFWNVAGFGQALVKTKVADITAGARLDHRDQYGSQFVPRIALTRAFTRFHVKALYSRAFRAPGLENVDINPTIQPEKTTVFELEMGQKITPDVTLSANLFDIRIDDPIVYGYDAVANEERYVNFPRTGSRGVEAELRVKKAWGYLNGSYSYYHAHDNQVPAYDVPGHEDALLGFPEHKVALLASVQVGGGVSVNPSLVFQGHRYGYDRLDADGGLVLGQSDSTALANLNLRVQPRRWRGASIDLAVFNLFDEKESFVQPYDGGHAAMPDRSREFLLRLAWTSDRR